MGDGERQQVAERSHQEAALTAEERGILARRRFLGALKNVLVALLANHPHSPLHNFLDLGLHPAYQLTSCGNLDKSLNCSEPVFPPARQKW